VSRQRLLVAINLALALALGAWVWSRLQPRLPTDARRDLLLDAARVELLEGFDDLDQLLAWSDEKRTNPDRTEIALPVRRDCKLEWRVEARPGRFEMGAARLQKQLGADDTPCRVRVSVPGRPALAVEAQLPACPPDDGLNPVERYDPADPGLQARLKWREGPAVPLALDLPEGAATLQIEVVSEGAPEDGAVALLSPRVEMEPLPVRAEDFVVTVPIERRLMADVAREGGAGARAMLGTRRRIEGGTEVGEVEPIEVGAVEALAAFPAKGGLGIDERPALVFTGDAAREFEVDLAPDTRLCGALAFDERMPPGTAAALEVSVDGASVAKLPVSGRRWQPVDLDLGARAGAGRRLRLALVDGHVEPDAIHFQEFDFARQVQQLWSVRAEQPRVAFSDPLLRRTTEVPRRLASARRPSVLLIQIETLRADVLPLFGGAIADLAPSFDALAKGGVVFERAMTPSSWTVPSTSTLLTGLPPAAHGAVDHALMVLPGDKPTLAELARAAGVATGAVVASDILRPAAGYQRGFESFARVPWANARQVNDLAAAFIENHAGQQFLLFLHYFDPHGPLHPPGEWRDRYLDPELRPLVVREAEARLLAKMFAAAKGEGAPPAPDDPDVRFLHGLYLGEVAWLDHQLGELLAGLERLGRARDTLVVVTADHGEEFMDHGMYGHGSQLFDETVHVPLLLRAPKDFTLPSRAGTRVSSVVSTAGLFASVLGWLGVPYDAESVLPGLERRQDFAISETSKGVAYDQRGDPFRRYLASVRTPEWRMVTRERVEGECGPPDFTFYDLRNDPGATRPLTREQVGDPAVLRQLSGLLEGAREWALGHRGAAPLPGGGEQTAATIAALGYAGPAGGGAPRPVGKARLAGTLRVRGGAAPPAGLRLVLVALDASRTETVLALGADGAWDAGEPAPGCWRLRVLQDGQDAPLLERDVMLDPGESQSVELVVEPAPR
jgi:arylsulfatase A-like enzyme